MREGVKMVADITTGVVQSYSVKAHAIVANVSRDELFSRAAQVEAVQNPTLRPNALGNDVARVAQSAEVFANLRGRQELLNQSAVALRDLSAAVEKSGQILGEMDKDLMVIVKMFPPYPVDNPERISLLNSFGGLRKQIEGLTFPPPETFEELGRLFKPVSSSGESGFDGPVDPAQFIKQPLFENIPALDPKSASDEDVINTLEQVRLLASTLGEFSKESMQGVFRKVNESDETSFDGKISEIREQLASLETIGGNQVRTGIGGDVLRLDQVVETN
jgi:hypothetical protein